MFFKQNNENSRFILVVDDSEILSQHRGHFKFMKRIKYMFE